MAKKRPDTDVDKVPVKKRPHTDVDRPVPKKPAEPLKPARPAAEPVDFVVGPDPSAAGTPLAKTVVSSDAGFFGDAPAETPVAAPADAGIFGDIPNLSLDEPEVAAAEVLELVEEPEPVAEDADEEVVLAEEPEAAEFVEAAEVSEEPVETAVLAEEPEAAEVVEAAAVSEEPVEAAVLADDEVPAADVLPDDVAEEVSEETVPVVADEETATPVEAVAEVDEAVPVEAVLEADEAVPVEAVADVAEEASVAAEVVEEPRSGHSSDVFGSEFTDKPAPVLPEPSAVKEVPVAAANDSAVIVASVAAEEPLFGPEPSGSGAEAASDVFAGEFFKDETAPKSAKKKEPSGIFSDARPTSAVEAAELVDEAVVAAEPTSAVLAAEEASVLEDEAPVVGEAASAVSAVEEASAEISADDAVIAAEPVSAVVAAASPASEPAAEEPSVEAALVDDAAIAAESASGVVAVESLEETSAELADDEPSVEAALVDDAVIAAESASGVVMAESLEEAPAEVAAEEPSVEAALVDAGEPAVAEADISEEVPVAAVPDEEPSVEAALADDEAITGEPASAVVEAAEAVAEEEPSVEAALSDDEAIAGEPASAVVEAAEVVAEEEPSAEAALSGDEVIAGEPASAVVEAAEVVSEEEPSAEAALSDDEVIAGEPASAVVEAAEVVSEEEPSAEAALSDDEVIAGEPASAVVEAAEVVAEEEPSVEAALSDDEVIAGEPASAVVEAAEVEADEEPSVEAALSDDEVIAGEPASAVVETAEVEADEEPSAEAALSDDEVIAGEPASAVVETAEVEADEEPSAEAALSDDEVIAGEPASADVEAAEVEADEEPSAEAALSDDEVIAGEPASAVVEAAEVVADEEPSVEAEEAAVVAETGSTVVPEAHDVEEALFADEAVAAEPASAVTEGKGGLDAALFPDEPASAVLEGDVVEAAEAGSSSVVLAGEEEVVAEPGSAVSLVDEEILEGTLDEEAPSAAEPASAVAALEDDAAEGVLDEEAPIAVEPASAVSVLDEDVLEGALDEDAPVAAEPASAVSVLDADVSEGVLDEDAPVAAEPASAVSVLDEDVLEGALDEETPVPAEPASAVALLDEDVAAEVLDDEVAVAVEPGSAVAEAEELSADAVEDSEGVLEDDAVVEAEPGSAVAVLEDADAELVDDDVAVAVETGSAIAVVEEMGESVLDDDEEVVAGAETGSAVMAAEVMVDDEEESADAEPGSAVQALDADDLFAAEMASMVDDAEAGSAVLAVEDVLEDEEPVAVEPASAVSVLEEDDVLVAESSSAVAAEEETADVEWDNVEETETAEQEEEEEHLAAEVEEEIAEADAEAEAEIAVADDDVVEEAALEEDADEDVLAAADDEIAEADEEALVVAEDEGADAEEALFDDEALVVAEDGSAVAEAAVDDDEIMEADEDVIGEAAADDQILEAEDDVIEAAIDDESTQADEEILIVADDDEIAEADEDVLVAAEAEEDIIGEAVVDEALEEGEEVVIEAAVDDDEIVQTEFSEGAEVSEAVDDDDDMIVTSAIEDDDLVVDAKVSGGDRPGKTVQGVRMTQAGQELFGFGQPLGLPPARTTSGPSGDYWPAARTTANDNWPAARTSVKPGFQTAAGTGAHRPLIVTDEGMVTEAVEDEILVSEPVAKPKVTGKAAAVADDDELITEEVVGDDAVEVVISEAVEHDLLVTEPLDDVLVSEPLDGGEMLVSEPLDMPVVPQTMGHSATILAAPTYSIEDLLVNEPIHDDSAMYGGHGGVRPQTVGDGYTMPSSRWDGGGPPRRYDEEYPAGPYGPPQKKSRHGLSFMAGLLLGWLLLAGVGVAAWYYRPDMVDEAVSFIPDSPAAEAPRIRLQPGDVAVPKDDLLALLPADKKPAEFDQKKVLELIQQNKAAKEKLDSELHAFAKGKFVDANKKFDVKGLEKQFEKLTAEEAMLARIRKELGGVKAADEAVANRLKEIGDLNGKLAEVNKSLDAVNASLKDASIDDNGAKGVEALTARRDELKKDRDKLEGIVKDAVKELVAARVPAGPDDLQKPIAVLRAQSENPIGKSLAFAVNSLSGVGPAAADYLEKTLDTTKVLAELKILKAEQQYLNTPAEKTTYYLTILKDRSKDPQDLLKAENHAKWLLEPNAKSSAEDKANAHYLLALVYRNRQEFDKAAAAIEDAKKEAEIVKDTHPARGRALLEKFDKSRSDFIDPIVYLKRAKDLEARGQFNLAVAELTLGLKAADHPKLYSRRAMLRLEAWRTANPGRTPSDDVYKAVAADADKARAGADVLPKIEATFAMGMIEEDRGNLKVAEDLYREALTIAKDNLPPDELNRIRLALGKILQRDRTPAGGAVPSSRLQEPRNRGPESDERRIGFQSCPCAVAGEEFVSADDEDANAEESPTENGTEEPQANFHPLSGLLAAVLVQQVKFDDDEDPAVAKRIKESLEIAEELIASDNPKIKGQGFLLKGLALAKKGRITEGLRLYVDGLKLVYPGKETKDLVKMVEEHPIFQQPDVATRPDKGLADFHYARGREFYFSRKYPEAEAHFKQAVTYTGDYAPYLYYLGLSQLQQNTRVKRASADYVFTKAGKLEAKGGENSFQQVNIHLERVQGELREHLNRYRMGGINTVN